MRKILVIDDNLETTEEFIEAVRSKNVQVEAINENFDEIGCK